MISTKVLYQLFDTESKSKINIQSALLLLRTVTQCAEPLISGLHLLFSPKKVNIHSLDSVAI